MTEKEQEILNMYLKDERKKRIIAIIVVFCIIIVGLSSAKKFISNNKNETSAENTAIENVSTNEVKDTISNFPNDLEASEYLKRYLKGKSIVSLVTILLNQLTFKLLPSFNK